MTLSLDLNFYLKFKKMEKSARSKKSNKSLRSNKSEKSNKSYSSNNSIKSYNSINQESNDINLEVENTLNLNSKTNKPKKTVKSENNKKATELTQEKPDYTNSKRTDTFHFLPCIISTNGFAPVSTFFNPTIRNRDTYNYFKLKNNNEYNFNEKNELNNPPTEKKDVLASFRGKLFEGKQVKQKLQYVKFVKEKNPVEMLTYDVLNNKEYFVWDFEDEAKAENYSLENINSILSNLSILK